MLKGKIESNKVNNWSGELSPYKLKTHYIKGTKNVLPDCLLRLVDAKPDCSYEPKGQEFECTILKELPLILNNS